MSASTNTLSAADQARLDTWQVEIAEDKLGPFAQEGDGDFYQVDSRKHVIHPGGLHFNFKTQQGGHGALLLIQLLYDLDAAEAMRFACKWLAEHPGEGRLAAGVSDEQIAKKVEAEDARRTAEVQTMVERRGSHKETPVDLYLAKRQLRGDDMIVGWLEPAQPGAYGMMITWATDVQGGALAAQLTRLTPEGDLAPVKWVSTTHRGPHNWKSRSVLRLNCDAEPDTVHLVEGFEDGLSLVMAGVRNVWVLWGVGRLKHLDRDLFPLSVKTIVVVRDDDGDNPKPDAKHLLWRGVTHLEGFGKEVKVTPRPRMVAGALGSVKDVNDLLCHGGVDLVQALMKAKPVGKEDLTGADREEIFDQASCMGRDEYDQGREAIAKRLSVRVGTLDEERKARHDKRAAGTRQNEAPNRDEFILTPHEVPVSDLGAVLDDHVGILEKILAVPSTHLDTMALWSVHTHVLQRRELGIRHTPRLAFQSPLEDSGKTTSMTTLIYVVARPMATSSLSGASLFRETDAHHWTALWDEADNAFHKNTAPELLGVFNAGWSKKFSLVHRQVPSAEGGYETQTFDTFTGIALTAIKAFPSRAMQSRCIVLVMQRATRAESARLEEFDETHEDALTECGRKYVRWGADIDALPTIDKKATGLINRIWLNWRPLLQIAELAGGTWPARALAAAKTDMARVTGEKDNSADYALLAAIWRVFTADTSNPRRMLTEDIIQKLLNEDEGRWLTANRGGKQIDKWYLRDKLKDFLPTEGKYSSSQSRRWRPIKSAKANPLWGYYELHFADAFERYLGKGLPSAEPRNPDLTADDPEPVHRAEEYTLSEGVTSPVLSDTPETIVGNTTFLDTYGVSDTPKTSDSVSDVYPLHPTHEHGVSDAFDTCVGLNSTSDTERPVQYQDVNPNVSSVSDKTPGRPPAAGVTPLGLVQFPQTPSGRSRRSES
jgi:Protein of unknown function (DUF3631)/Toprim domain